LNQGDVEKLIDPRLGGAFDVTQLKRLAFAASLCIRSSSMWRPTMSEVAKKTMMYFNYLPYIDQF